MVEMTLEVSDSLAKQIRSFGVWSPSVLELRLANFKTSVKEVAEQAVKFLLKNPAPQEVLNYYVSDQTHAQLQKLLEINSDGLTNEAQQAELDEWEKFTHIMIMLKAKAAKILKNQNAS